MNRTPQAEEADYFDKPVSEFPKDAELRSDNGIPVQWNAQLDR